jgi:hypothetical protein
MWSESRAPSVFKPTLDAEDWSAYLSDSISHNERDYGRFGKGAVFVPQVAWIGGEEKIFWTTWKKTPGCSPY